MNKCKRCGNRILDTERQILLKTFDDKKTYEELYFHINCWWKEIREGDEKRALALYQKSMSKGMSMLGDMFNNGRKKKESQIYEVGIS